MRRLLAVLLSLSLVFQNIVVVMPVAAQVTASPTAPSGQRPLVDGTANGVPLVNIAPPSAGGVSHNQYNQFNVDQRGLILNNSMRPTDTTLSGWVNGNPQLGSTPARVILNEVVGGNASQLRGYLEIAGQRAELVVANPNGIDCNGCGFLNASRVMLGTGTPQMNGGTLDRLTPGAGSLSVGTKGLDARTVEQLDLLSREIVVEGDVLAQDLAVIASSNQVLYGTLRILDGTGDPNTSGQKFALDVKALGGMYANQIHMIATDKGLGVNSAGTLATKQGNLEISANGDIRIHDTFSQQDMILDGPGDVRLTGRTQAEGRLSLETKGQLINEGELQAGTSDITVTGDFVNSGQINSSENLTLSSGGSLVNRGKDAVLQAGETLFLTAGRDIHNEGALNGVQTVTVTAGQDIRNDGIVNGGQTVTVTAGRDIRSDGTVSSGQTMTVTAQTGTLTDHGQRSYTEQRESTVGGTVTAGGNLSVVATDKDVTLHGAQLTAGGDATLAAARDVTVSALVTENTSHYTSNTTAPGVKKSDSSNSFDQTVNGSSVSGDTVTIVAERDVAVRGSTVVGTKDVTLYGGKDVSLEAVTESSASSHSSSKSKSGVFASGTGVTIGTQKQSLSASNATNLAVGSTVGSLEGDVSIRAGDHYRQKGSSVVAVGIVAGLAGSGWDDVSGMYEFLSDPITGLNGLKDLVSSPEMMKKLGADVVDGYIKKLDAMAHSLEVGGDEEAYLLGKNLGDLIWDVSSAVLVVKGAAKGTVALAKTGMKVADKTLDLALGMAKFDGLLKAGPLVGVDGKTLMDFSRLTSAQKGIIGELMGEMKIAQLIPGVERVGTLPGIGGTGIDDLLRVSRPGVDYVVVEYKFGSSVLGKTLDGLQMSDDWLKGATTGIDRIAKSIGDNPELAKSVNNALESGRIEKWLVHTDPYGGVTVGVLDKSGKLVNITADASKLLGGVK